MPPAVKPPPVDTTRWTAGRKAALVRAVEAKVLTVAEAGEIYGVSPFELQRWGDLLAMYGRPGLRVAASRWGRP